MPSFDELLAWGAVSHRWSAVYMNSPWRLADLPSFYDAGWPTLREGKWNTLFQSEGPGMIAHIWCAFPPRDTGLGRRTLVRMFWDGEAEPSVEAPLTDFFGVPFGYSGAECHLASRYLVVAPTDALNCYFPMPYAKSARIEVLPEQVESGGGLYFQLDYYRFAAELPPHYRDVRFHAQYRFENPCEEYGRNYLFLDAKGTGALVGATFGIESQPSPADAWFHGGGDSIFVDGEDLPSALHGIGGEDFFGQAWGAMQFQSAATGAPLVETDDQGNLKRIALYRFFVDDPLPFRHSLRATLGALGNAYSSVAYWYQTEPHRRFFRVPAADERMPGVLAPYGRHDVEPDDLAEWSLLAPFPLCEDHPFEEERPFELGEAGDESYRYQVDGLPSRRAGNTMQVQWRPQRAYHHFIDFNVVARPAVQTIRLEAGVVGYAVRYVDSVDEQEVTIHVGFDDEMLVRVNDEMVFRANHPQGFEARAFRAHLRRGRNRILVKLSNFDNTTWRLWAFAFRIEAEGGQAL
jgi:hypothetical protein